MKRLPEIKISFSLTKRTCEDFDRERVTERLGIIPTEQSAPTVSKGYLKSYDFDNDNSDFVGHTVLKSEKPPYQFINHAYLSFESQKYKLLSVDDALRAFMPSIQGIGQEIREVCSEYDLYASLNVSVYADSSNMPLLDISAEAVSFFGSIGVSIDFDLQLD